MYTLRPGIWWENWKTWQMRQKYCLTRNLTRNIQKPGKWEMHTGGPGLWRENWKTGKETPKQCSAWYIVRNTQKRRKWEMYTVGPGVCRENWKSWENRNTHSKTWNMVRNTKNVGNEKCTLLDLEYGEKNSNHGKWEMQNVGTGIWL